MCVQNIIRISTKLRALGPEQRFVNTFWILLQRRLLTLHVGTNAINKFEMPSNKHMRITCKLCIIKEPLASNRQPWGACDELQELPLFICAVGTEDVKQVFDCLGVMCITMVWSTALHQSFQIPAFLSTSAKHLL